MIDDYAYSKGFSFIAMTLVVVVCAITALGVIYAITALVLNIINWIYPLY